MATQCSPHTKIRHLLSDLDFQRGMCFVNPPGLPVCLSVCQSFSFSLSLSLFHLLSLSPSPSFIFSLSLSLSHCVFFLQSPDRYFSFCLSVCLYMSVCLSV